MRKGALRIHAYGPVRPAVLRSIRKGLERTYRVRVRAERVARRLGIRGYARSRDQYRADVLLDRIDRSVNEDGATVVAVTEASIYEPGFNYLFGLSYLGGRCALVALADLSDTDIERAIDRAVKIAVHETGHALGLDHCRAAGCVMRYADRVSSVDRESGRLCRSCRDRLRTR